MPGNLVVINGSKDLTWYVGDSKINELIEFLHIVGFQQQSDEPTNNKNLSKEEKE